MVISTFESCGGLGSRCSCGVLSGVFPTVIVLCLNYLPSEPISLTSSICLLLFFIFFFCSQIILLFQEFVILAYAYLLFLALI